MEEITKYQEIIQAELEYRQSIKIQNGPELVRHLVINAAKTEFVLLDVGWFNKRYISDLVFHIEIPECQIKNGVPTLGYPTTRACTQMTAVDCSVCAQTNLITVLHVIRLLCLC